MSDVRRITDPGAYTAALEALDKIIQKKANRVHGKPGADGIFKVTAVYQKKARKKYKPQNYLSPPPDAPEAWLSNLSVYRMRTVGGWILPPKEESWLLFFIQARRPRPNRPDLAELDKNHIWPPHRWWYQFPKWTLGQSVGGATAPAGFGRSLDLKTWSFRWVKNGLALHFHKLILEIVDQREWRREGLKPIANPARHLPFEDRIAAGMLGLAVAIHRFDAAKHTSGLCAYAIHWIRKELQRLARNERRQPQEERDPYGFSEGEFGPGIPMSFRPPAYPLIRYDEDSYERRPQYINIGDCVVENIKLGAPADDNDDAEHDGPSFANWSPINPETALLFKEATLDTNFVAPPRLSKCATAALTQLQCTLFGMIGAQRKRNRVVTPARPTKALVVC